MNKLYIIQLDYFDDYPGMGELYSKWFNSSDGSDAHKLWSLESKHMKENLPSYKYILYVFYREQL